MWPVTLSSPNGPEWVEMRREAYRAADQWDSEEDDPEISGHITSLFRIRNLSTGRKEVIQQGFVQNYQLGISGGNE